MATDNDPNVQIESGGITFNVATDAIIFSGATAHFQYMKLAYGPTGSVSIVSSSNPLPVNVLAGGITANLVGFCGAIQGIAGGTPVVVSGTVYTIGVTTSPVFVKTATGSQVEVTGGRQLSKTTDAVSVFGPSGVTWIYSNLVNSSGTEIGTVSNPVYVNVSGATINATINPTVGVTNTSTDALYVRGVTNATPIPVSVGNTVGINDTNILSGMTSIYGQIVGMRTDLGGFAVVRPSGICGGRITVTTVASQMDSAGYTCNAGVQVKASSTNTDIIFLNNSALTSSGIGYELDPGESLFIDVVNTNKIYVKTKSGNQIISYMAS